MSFEAQKIEGFTEKISQLPDQPNMRPAELKAYFDSSPEELRQAHNSLCDALGQSGAASVVGFTPSAGVPATTVQSAVENVQQQVAEAVLGNIPSGSVNGDKLSQDVRDRFAAIESAAAQESAARQGADSAEASARAGADANLQNQINAHTGQINTKCEVYMGAYEGDDATERMIPLGFTPRAVIVADRFGQMVSDTILTGGLVTASRPVIAKDTNCKILEIVAGGFKVFQHSREKVCVNSTSTNYTPYHYIAVK